MKKLITISLLTTITLILLTGQAIATKPGEDTNPNGFPSGPHFNLNIIGKKPEFTCPELEFDPDTGLPIYGNVIFVPQSGEGIQILMESGKKGGKGKKNQDLPDTLQVTDPCTSAFDGDPAVLQLPKGEHKVYARALAKPGEDVEMVITPGLIAVEDEDGNDLIYLGLLTDNGFETPYESFVRPKGKPKAATDITGLFLWTGEVWYFIPPEDGYDDTKWVCCRDTSDPPDGIYDECIPTIDASCPDVAPGEVPYDLVQVYLNRYEDKWVFSIADFVTYLWNLDNNGLKLLQVRFYPVNPEPELAPSRQNTLATQWGNIKSK